MRTRTFTELSQIESFEDRFRYLALRGAVGASTFGYDRWVNQEFYRSRQWRQIRDHVIIRDNGCDLGMDGYEIYQGLYVHHMNPLTVDDILDGDDALDPEFLITVTHRTHNAIHYGDEGLLKKAAVPRRPGDTQLWTRRTG